MSNSGYNVELAFPSKESDEAVPIKCYANCDVCLNKSGDFDQAKYNWKIIKGKYFMVSGANISCACTRSPNGLSPYSHLGDGCVDLILVKHTNLFNNLRLLIRLSSKNKSVVSITRVIDDSYV